MLRKRVALLERRSDVTFDEFDRHWATEHSAIIEDLPGLQQYVQNSVVERWIAPTASDIDGVVEVWFDDDLVTSPEQHTSMAQQDDEITFIRTLTAITVTDRRSYSSDEKVWILSDSPIDRIPGMAVPASAIWCSPEPGAVLMERTRLRRDSAPPQTIVIIPVDAAEAHAVFESVVSAFTENGMRHGVRVLRTRSRRVR